MKARLLFALAAITLCVGQFLAPAAAIAAEPQGPPDIGWSTPCEIVSVYDGDTIIVEVRRRFRVRLLDCWAPELHKAEQRAAALESKAAMEAVVKDGTIEAGTKARMFIPLHERKDGVVYTGDSTSLSRVLGDVWLDGMQESLSQIMVRTGYALKEKPPNATED